MAFARHGNRLVDVTAWVVFGAELHALYRACKTFEVHGESQNTAFSDSTAAISRAAAGRPCCGGRVWRKDPGQGQRCHHLVDPSR